MSRFEQAVLRFRPRVGLDDALDVFAVHGVAAMAVLAKAEAPFGWYNIEVRLSNMDLSERPRLPPVLARLRDVGLVTETHHEDEPTLRYALTSAGRAAAGIG